MKNAVLAGLIVVSFAVSGCSIRSDKTADKTKDALVDQLSTYGGPQTASLRFHNETKHETKHETEIEAKRERKKVNQRASSRIANNRTANKGMTPGVMLPHPASQANLPGEVRGTGWHIPWYAPDPKNPKRPRQRVLVADAKYGVMDSKRDFLTIHMTDVIATLYQADKPSATILAPRVTTNEHDRIVVATGRVTIHSLIDPTVHPKSAGTPDNGSANTSGNKAPDPKIANTTVTADKMTWDTHTTNVVCTGNAILVVKQPGSPDIKQYSQRIIYNTETRAFHADNLLP